MTIIVLLILASITISAIFSDNGIIKKAQEAANKMNEAIGKEQDELNQLYNDLASALNNTTEDPGEPEEPEESEGLEIGSTVTYNPSGTYNWQAKYCSSTKTETTDDVTLNSSIGEDFNISSWKVLSIDEQAGTVKLVPSAQTTGTVYLGQAQGYNNGVKLLNDACSSLYGNSEKGITARSINIEDIEKYMTDTALTEAHNYTNSNSNTKYGNQVSSAYTSGKRYPAIYAQEKLAVINGTPNGDTGLGLSNQDAFIERTEGTNGAIATATSIQPYQTYWYKDATFMSTAFEDYTKQDSSTANYYNLIMPKGTNTTYWVASRCVNAYSSSCYFRVRAVLSGGVGAISVYNSGDSTNDGYSRALFPVITLNSSLIEGDASTGFSVK